MLNASRPEAGWDTLLVLALSMEAAFVAENWIEFKQLCRQRSAIRSSLIARGETPDQRLLRTIEEVDARVERALMAKRRDISENLRRIAKFRKSLAGT
jgi:antirestriction protein ArdC